MIGKIIGLQKVKEGQSVKYRGFPCCVSKVIDKKTCEITSAMGPKVVPIGELINFKIYILCAAIYYKDDKEYKHQPKNIKTGFVLCGRRHHNCIASAAVFGTRTAIVSHTMGFITSDDRFLNREESAKVAFEAKQIEKEADSLQSEDLY